KGGFVLPTELYCRDKTFGLVVDHTFSHRQENKASGVCTPEVLLHLGSLFVPVSAVLFPQRSPHSFAGSDLPAVPRTLMPCSREAVLNALVHGDYRIHTEGMPVGRISAA